MVCARGVIPSCIVLLPTSIPMAGLPPRGPSVPAAVGPASCAWTISATGPASTVSARAGGLTRSPVSGRRSGSTPAPPLPDEEGGRGHHNGQRQCRQQQQDHGGPIGVHGCDGEPECIISGGSSPTRSRQLLSADPVGSLDRGANPPSRSSPEWGSGSSAGGLRRMATKEAWGSLRCGR